MISYKDLAKHEAKYRLHPVRQLREMHNYADPIVMKYNLREQYLRQPKAVTVQRRVLKLPTEAAQSGGEVVIKGLEPTTLAGLGPRIKQLRFLADYKLYPPDEELNLDAWVSGRLSELRSIMPRGTTATLQSWLSLKRDERNDVLTKEYRGTRDVARARLAIDQDRQDDERILREKLETSVIPKLILKNKKRAAAATEAKKQQDKINRAAANELIFRQLPPRAARTEANRRIYEQSPVGRQRAKDDTFEPGDASDAAFNARYPSLARPAPPKPVRPKPVQLESPF